MADPVPLYIPLPGSRRDAGGTIPSPQTLPGGSTVDYAALIAAINAAVANGLNTGVNPAVTAAVAAVVPGLVTANFAPSAVAFKVTGKEPMNAVTELGFKGDGTYADTEILQNALRTSFTGGRDIFIPAGTWYLHHPITVIASSRLVGASKTFTDGGHGTSLRPSSTFDLAYNDHALDVSGLSAQKPRKPAMIQSQAWAPDPFYPAIRWGYFDGLCWHGAQIESLELYNLTELGTKIAGLDGLVCYYPGEKSLLSDLSIYGFETNYRLTGNMATLTVQDCTSWYASDYGFRMEMHPVFSGGYGRSNFTRIGGDANLPGLIRVTNTYTVTIFSSKIEQQSALGGCFLTVDVEKRLIGTGTGNNTFTSKAVITVIGCLPNSTNVLGPMPYFVQILHTGSSNPSEYPTPALVLIGNTSYPLNFLLDDTVVPPVIIGDTNGVGIRKRNPYAFFTYCRDGYDGEVHSMNAYTFLNGIATFEKPPIFPAYTVANLPPAANGAYQRARATNGRLAGQTAGNGTGCWVWSNGGSWLTDYDNSLVAA